MKLSAIALFFFMSFFAVKVVAQQRFIELSATDTIELKPVQFTYQVSVTAHNNYDFNPGRMFIDSMNKTLAAMRSQVKKPNTSVAQIVSLLDANKYHYTIAEETGYNISSYDNSRDSSFQVTISTEAEVKKLFGLLNSLNGINGHISHIEYEKIPAYGSIRYNNLYAKAKMEAILMAQASGNTVGQLISVEEDKNPLTQAIEEIKNVESQTLRANLYGTELTKKIYKKLLFKFELK